MLIIFLALKSSLRLLPVAKSHGFCCSCGLIQQGGVGDGETCHVYHHCLIVQQTLQSPLGQLCLVRGVLGGPVLEHIEIVVVKEPELKGIKNGLISEL